MTTLMQYRRLVRSRLGVPITDDFFDDATIDDHVNLALSAISSEFRWPWNEWTEQITLGDGDETFPLPELWNATRLLFLVPDIELSLVSPADIIRWNATSHGRPSVWCPLGNEAISVRPIGGGDLIHTYYRDEPWLLADTDQPRLPNQYAGAVVAKAAELLAQREDNRGGASVQLSEYQSWVARMRRDVRNSTGPVVPRVRPGSWITV